MTLAQLSAKGLTITAASVNGNSGEVGSYIGYYRKGRKKYGRRVYGQFKDGTYVEENASR